ncbi:glycosyltransferase family 4 protein [Pikeienuella piscinae]|uniref:Glycosyltransferase family 4 protein n=1 Tax=Pikeienuella piscinae TaxID=2748098 RepID=A0A7L5BT95_9RHOB|nr:glycosyltransferase family 4 protein [Pikeienuella piscinae]QIE55130.1 glycosyltransferase family 4 protein [Pikeienuella piscinae]
MRALARLAVPGDPDTPTGGYVYARRVIAASGGALAPLALPGGFPFPDQAALDAAASLIAAANGPVIVDGLAYGAFPAELIEALPRAPLALCHHPLGMETGLEPETARHLIESERAALARAAHVIAASEATKALLIAEFGLADENVTVASPGLDPAPPARGADGPPTILTVASLTPRKDHLTLIAALARLAESRPDLDWRAVFAGPEDRAPATAAAIRDAIRDAGLAGRIERLGALGPAALDGLYDRAAIFALASRYEGYGMVFAEAMMRALPVVACDIGAEGAAAPAGALRLVPVGDADAMAAALAWFLESPQRRREAGNRARAHALSLHDWTATWAAFGAALKSAA